MDLTSIQMEFVVPDSYDFETGLPAADAQPVATQFIGVSDPRPTVTITNHSVSIGSQSATVTLSGYVRDPIADNVPREGGADIETVSITVDGSGGTQAQITQGSDGDATFWRQHPYKGTFGPVNVSVPLEQGTHIVRVETSENAAGRTGWGELAVTLGQTIIPGSTGGNGTITVNIAFDAEPTLETADSFRYYYGERPPEPEDAVLSEEIGQEDSFIFLGEFDDVETTVTITAINSQPVEQFTAFDPNEPDVLEAEVTYTFPGGSTMTFTGTFTETDDDGMRFRAEWAVMQLDDNKQYHWNCSLSSEAFPHRKYFPSQVRIIGLSTDETEEYSLLINDATSDLALFNDPSGDAYVESAEDARAIVFAYQELDQVTSSFTYHLGGFARSADDLLQIDPILLADTSHPSISMTLKRGTSEVVCERVRHLAKVEIITPDAEGNSVVTTQVPVSNPRPEIILQDILISDIQISGEMATVYLIGEVFDPIADNFPRKPILQGGADIASINVLVDGKVYQEDVVVTPDLIYEQNHRSFWRQHPYRGTFQATLSFAAKGSRIIAVQTEPNVAGRTAVDVAWLHFTEFHEPGPYVLKSIDNFDGSDPGTYYPIVPRVSKELGTPDEICFTQGNDIWEVEEVDGYYYPKGASRPVVVYCVQWDDEAGKFKLMTITYRIDDGMMVEKKIEKVQFVDLPANTLIESIFVSSYYPGLMPLPASTSLLNVIGATGGLNSSVSAYMSGTANDYSNALIKLRDLHPIDFPAVQSLPEWRITCEELVQLSTELPGVAQWQKLIFIIDHWDDVKAVCNHFSIPPEVFFATLFAEYSDNDFRHPFGEWYDSTENIWNWPRVTGFGIANLPAFVVKDSEWLGYNLHSNEYLGNLGVPETIRTKFNSLKTKDRDTIVRTLFQDRVLSIWIHAARMKAIADTLVSINPGRFHARDAQDNYDWTAEYIDDFSGQLMLAQFVMLSIENMGFARVPEPVPADRCMIDIPNGFHEGTQSTRTNLTYVNVWKRHKGSDNPGDWKPESGLSSNEWQKPYAFCTTTFEKVLTDTLIIFQVFKKSSVYP